MRRDEGRVDRCRTAIGRRRSVFDLGVRRFIGRPGDRRRSRRDARTRHSADSGLRCIRRDQRFDGEIPGHGKIARGVPGQHAAVIYVAGHKTAESLRVRSDQGCVQRGQIAVGRSRSIFDLGRRGFIRRPRNADGVDRQAGAGNPADHGRRGIRRGGDSRSHFIGVGALLAAGPVSTDGEIIGSRVVQGDGIIRHVSDIHDVRILPGSRAVADMIACEFGSCDRVPCEIHVRRRKKLYKSQ